MGQRVQVGGRGGHQGGEFAGQQVLQPRDLLQGLPDRGHLPGGGLLQGHPGGEALQVAQALQGLAPAGPQQAVLKKKFDAVQPGLDGRQVLQGIAQPAAQAPGPHGGDGAVQGVQERALAGAAAPGLEDLQVAQGGFIQSQVVVPGIGKQPVQVGQFRGVGVVQIAEDGPGRGNPQGVVFHAEAVQEQGAQGPAQFPPGRLRVEGVAAQDPTGGRGVEGRQSRGQQAQVRLFGDDEFRRLQAPELIAQAVGPLPLGEAELAGGDLQKGQAPGGAPKIHRGQVIVPPGVQGRRVHQGAPGEDPGHLPAHQALGLGRVLGLVADHHLEARVQQFGDVALGRMDGEAGHGDALGVGAAPGGEGDVQGARRRLRRPRRRSRRNRPSGTGAGRRRTWP